MENIKFRGKRKDTLEWVEGDYFRENHLGEIRHCIIRYERLKGCDVIYEVIPETIGQFTGLTDKNGKDIYEGDILYDKFEDKYEEKGYCVLYNKVDFQFGAYGLIGEITGEFLPFFIYPIGKEIVISNIHDNPELLTSR